MGIRVGAIALVLVTAALATGGTAAAGESIHYQPPVDAPVADGFRPPSSPYGPGNRGLTYDLEPGTPVRASAPGEVVFAGSVAGTLHVTVLHADGLRTSYSFLDSVAVRRGTSVAAGDVVGRGGAGFHFGVRDGDIYLDPASLFGVVEVRVRLVPHDEAAPPTDEGLMRERIALTEVVREKGLLRRALEWGVGTLERQVETGLGVLDLLVDLHPPSVLHRAFTSLQDSLRQECTAADVPAPERPGTGRVALLVAGYGSTSANAAVDDVDTDVLGYGDRVLRYSYAGGRIPTPDGRDSPFGQIPTNHYDPSDTFGDLRTEGVALADLVEAAASARPGRPIDLVAHSQGGIVTRLAVAELDRRGRLDLLGTVITIGTPHRGVDLGSAALVLGTPGHLALRPLTALTDGGVDSQATSVAQMAETSELVLALRRDGVPDGVDLRTIGATGDLVVTGGKTSVDGHPAAMVSLFGPHAHDALPGHADTTRELALALGGLAPGCRSVGERIADAFVPEAISFGQDAVVGPVAVLFAQ